MKTIKHLVFLLLSVFLLSACSSDDELMPTDGDRTPVSFTANVSRLKTTDGGDQWAAGDQLGIFMKQAGEDLSSAIESNRKYQTDAEGNFTLADGGEIIYWPQDETTVDFVAYYPYQASFSTPYIYEVDVSDQSDPAKIDLLYSNDATNKSKSKEAVALTFHHQLTKVVMTLKKGEGLSDAELATLTVKLTNMPTTADFSLADGAWSNKDNKTEITPFKVGNGYEAILIPQGAGAKGKMIFKLGNETFSYTITDELEAGNQYTYNVTVTRQGIEVKKGDITPWEELKTYKFGDFYPDATNPIGVVCQAINGGRSGMVVSLDEPDAELLWADDANRDYETYATDEYNGRKNMHTIAKLVKKGEKTWDNFPAFAWVHSKNSPSEDYSDSNAKGVWYLPAIEELFLLYFLKDELNTSLIANYALLQNERYWSSSENLSNGAWRVTFVSGYRGNVYKNYHSRVRCVSAF